MARINTLRKMPLRVAAVLLAGVLLIAQVSTILASPQATCVPSAGSLVTSTSSQDHQCCCGETGSCCCNVRQGSTAVFPDMALAAVSDGAYNPTSSTYAALDAGSQIPLLTQAFKWGGRRTGTGPPLTLSYLVNLTFRC